MNCYLVFCVLISSYLAIPTETTKVLKRFFDTATVCEKYCDDTYQKDTLQFSCGKGCRLLTIIALAKELPRHDNKTEKLCYSACEEAYTNAPEAKACNDGCKREAISSVIPDGKQENQTLHLLTPLMYVKSAYKTVAAHMKQLITSSFTLYVEEDTGKMVVLQTNPKTIIELSNDKGFKNPLTNDEMPERSDWMDCISQQSGLPRWILVSVLFGFIVTLLWLCCVTTATAPNHHLSSTKKFSPKNDIAYLYFYEPIDEVKIQPPSDHQAPPLPVKVTLP